MDQLLLPDSPHILYLSGILCGSIVHVTKELPPGNRLEDLTQFKEWETSLPAEILTVIQNGGDNFLRILFQDLKKDGRKRS